MPLCVKRPIPELSVPPLRGAVWLEAVRRQLAVVEQDVGHVAADGQGHAWATTAFNTKTSLCSSLEMQYKDGKANQV